MKSAVLKNGKIEIIERNKPLIENRKGAVIKVHGCGLCGSDIVKINHAAKENEDKIVLGHEIVGEIVEINSDTDFKIGDIIAMGHHYPCFECKYCAHGSHSMCQTFKKTNIEPSGFSEYIFASEGHLKNTVFKKPDNLSEEEFSFLEPLSCCIRAIRRAGLELNKDNSSYNVLVLGLGSIGILMSQGLKAYGAKTYGFDINEKRQEFVKKYGINFNPEIKYDVIFMTSGSDKAIKTAIDLVEAGGKIVVFSSVKNEEGYTNNDIYYKELSIIGSYSPTPFDLKLSYDFLKNKYVDVKNLSTRYNIDRLQNAIDDTVQGKILKGYIEL